MLIGTSSLRDKEVEKVKVLSAFLPCPPGKVGSQAPKLLHRGRTWGRKCSPSAEEKCDKDCSSYLDVYRSMGCIEGDVWCDCEATLCHLGNFLKAGRRQMLHTALKRAKEEDPENN